MTGPNPDAKNSRYAELVARRKACRLCSGLGLTNPSVVDGGRFDCDHVGHWSRWQGNLDADVMVVGQDWGDTAYLRRTEGWEKPGNPTNRTLVELLSSIGVAVPPAGRNSPGPNAAFFTNAILCLKEGGLQGDVREEWFDRCRPFLREQIEIIEPKVVIGLGQRAFDSILRAFELQPQPLRAAVECREGTLLPNGTRAFAVYHCGARTLNTARALDAQRRDWARITTALGQPLRSPRPASSDRPALPRLMPRCLTGNEPFHERSVDSGIRLLDFWRWSSSDLVSNTLRGILAEFLVASALGIDTASTPRDEWGNCDLVTAGGIRLEVKSAAYLQTWAQRQHSKVKFSVRPHRGWDPETLSYDTEARRHAHVYVFALLAHGDKSTLDPLDLAQWRFWVVPTTRLDVLSANGRDVPLSVLERDVGAGVAFVSLRSAVEKVVRVL